MNPSFNILSSSLSITSFLARWVLRAGSFITLWFPVSILWVTKSVWLNGLSGSAKTHEHYLTKSIKCSLSCKVNLSETLSIRGCKCWRRTLSLGVVLSPCTSSMTSTLLNTPITLSGPNFTPFWVTFDK